MWSAWPLRRSQRSSPALVAANANGGTARMWRTGVASVNEVTRTRGGGPGEIGGADVHALATRPTIDIDSAARRRAVGGTVGARLASGVGARIIGRCRGAVDAV